MYYVLCKLQPTITTHNCLWESQSQLETCAQLLLKMFPLVLRKLQLSVLTLNIFPDLTLIRPFHFWVQVVY